MRENKQDSGADTPVKFLESREERIKLLKSGFTGKQVEALYFVLNRFETVGVDWDEGAVKCIQEKYHHFLHELNRPGSMHMLAASSQGASA